MTERDAEVEEVDGAGASAVDQQAGQADPTARLAALEAIPVYYTRAGLPPIADTSREAEPDIYGYSEREAAQL